MTLRHAPGRACGGRRRVVNSNGASLHKKRNFIVKPPSTGFVFCGRSTESEGRLFFMFITQYYMRTPCPGCGSSFGILEQKSGQNTIHCANCGRHCYNAPKTETGEKPRSVSTVHASIRPKDRVEIIERATGRCELCGTSDAILHVGHILSVDDGLGIGFTELELNDPANLAAMCEECNLGLGKLSISPRLYIALLKKRLGK